MPKKYIFTKKIVTNVFSAQNPAWEVYSGHSGFRSAPTPKRRSASSKTNPGCL